MHIKTELFVTHYNEVTASAWSRRGGIVRVRKSYGMMRKRIKMSVLVMNGLYISFSFPSRMIQETEIS